MVTRKALKIAILGTRGIPAHYGGFETFAEEFSVRLAKHDYDVSVYCRPGETNRNLTEYKGVKLIVLPTIKNKYFETVCHTFLSSIHALFHGAKILYFCNSINAVFMLLPLLFGKKVIINVDGLEWRRAKWSSIGKFAYKISEWIAARSAHVVIADSKRMRFYYKHTYGRKAFYASYGAYIQEKAVSKGALIDHGLEERRYFLIVTRLEPENNVHLMIKAYEKLTTDMPLVIVGDAPYAKPYIQELRSSGDPRIRFLGGVYGEPYRELVSHAYVYLHGSEVGGTNPALLAAMAMKNCVIANGVRFNRDVLGNAGLHFKPGSAADLTEKMAWTLANPEKLDAYRSLAVERIRKYYDWDRVTRRYEKLFRLLA